MDNKKITLNEFFESRKKLAIHCDTEEKANLLLKAFDKMGKKWCDGGSFLEKNDLVLEMCKEETCYSNDGRFGRKGLYRDMDYTVYEFEEVEL